MSMESAAALQEALFAVLAADPELMARLTGLYDAVPECARYPFLTMGPTEARDLGTKDRSGAAIMFELQLWSADPGQMDMKELMAITDRVLQQVALNVAGFVLISLVLESAEISQQASDAGSRTLGHLRYRASLFAGA